MSSMGSRLTLYPILKIASIRHETSQLPSEVKKIYFKNVYSQLKRVWLLLAYDYEAGIALHLLNRKEMAYT